MPSIRRRARHRRQDFEELTADQRRHLTRGNTFFRGGFRDEDSFRAAWEIHGETLLAEWIEKLPGTRPLGWWICDHGRERPVNPELATHERANRRNAPAEHFGFLHSRCWFPGVGYLQQPEREYLAKQGLLIDSELTTEGN